MSLVTGTFENGRREGLWTLWDAKGVKTQQITYRSGMKEGQFLGWYSSFVSDETATGKLLYEGRFSADGLNGDMNLYYPTGKVRCQFGFDNGQVKSAQCWDEQGRQLSQTQSLENARSEAIYIDTYLKSYDEDVKEGMKQLLLSTRNPP
jgi:antitoxin component YwqK of YwqJK toxin-antitoxin module